MGPCWGPSAFCLVVNSSSIVQFSSKADLERTEVERWKREAVENVEMQS